MVEYLFVRHFQTGALEGNVLTLEGIAAQAMFFSDRPHRIVGREPTEFFVDAWDEDDESFAVVPPNAVLTVVRDRESRDIVIVLKDPVLTGDTLVYQVEVLDGPKEAAGVYGTLFIDVIGGPMRGQSRRVARRTARRTTRRVNRRDDALDGDSDSDSD